MAPLISVVVCTYNRSSFLETCLQSLANQTLDKKAYEVVIVDNHSTDKTQEVAERFTRTYGTFRVIRENMQGLSYARNRGWHEAKGGYVAYIDDDARAAPDWCEQIKIFFEKHSDAKGVGGPYKAYTPSPPPEWFPSDYGSWTLGEATRPLGNDEWINGTNMIFAIEALRELDGFQEKLGMRGERLSYGEETNYLIRLREKEYLLYFCPLITVEHAILSYKFSLSWLFKSSYANGMSARRTFQRTRPIGKCLSMVCTALVKGVVNLIISQERFFRTRVYYAFNPFYWHLGFLVGHLRRN
ncbi:MAG TPA: glycosyltransferase family 2 protein [Nitrospiria bacterium]|nr:glycosyltransferase family 2 protein [Nitrospiria bacterium]